MSMPSLTGFLKGILLQGATDRSIQLALTPGGSTGTSTTLTSSQTTNRTLTLPDANGILLTTGSPIPPSQLTPLTPDQSVVTDGSGFLTTSTTTATEISYVHGVTSNIQTQLNSAAVNPMTTLGDMLYENATPAPTRLPGNTTTTRQFLSQTGNGTISAAPAWVTIEDSNGNLAANSFIPGFNTITTTGGTTTLTVASAEQQTLTGTSTETVNLPVVGTLTLGQQYIITNVSTGAVLVTTSSGAGGGSIVSLPSNTSATFTYAFNNGVSPSSWTFVLDNALAPFPPMLNPMTTGGDLIYGGTSGTPTRLANGSSGQVLTSSGTTVAPTWTTPALAVPSGTVSMFAGSSAPTGYLFCDGSAVSRTTFSTLFGVISTTYGVGDGSTTFNLPNTQGIFVRGAGSQTIVSTTYTGTLAAKNNDHIGSHTHPVLGGNGGTTLPLTNASVTALCGLSSTGVAYQLDAPASGNPFVEYSGGLVENYPANIGLNYMIKT